MNEGKLEQNSTCLFKWHIIAFEAIELLQYKYFWIKLHYSKAGSIKVKTKYKPYFFSFTYSKLRILAIDEKKTCWLHKVFFFHTLCLYHFIWGFGNMWKLKNNHSKYYVFNVKNSTFKLWHKGILRFLWFRFLQFLIEQGSWFYFIFLPSSTTK